MRGGSATCDLSLRHCRYLLAFTFALCSLTARAFRDPQGTTTGRATCDLSLRALSIPFGIHLCSFTLTARAFRDPQGTTKGRATCDLSLRALSMPFGIHLCSFSFPLSSLPFSPCESRLLARGSRIALSGRSTVGAVVPVHLQCGLPSLSAPAPSQLL